MTPEELKNTILQLAIQGKLVEQRLEEGTAEELYRKIIAEKRLQKAKVKKDMNRITDEDIPFDIPDNWRWVRFGDIVSYSMGKTPPRSEEQWWKSEFPWVSIADMPESGHINKTKESISNCAVVKKFGNRISCAGTMLMSFKLTVGRVSILDIDAVHNEAIISIYPFYDQDNVIQSYLFRILPLATRDGDSKNAIKGRTLNDTSICNLLLPLPPLAEQKRIVAKIEELLPHIDRYGQAWSKLEDFNKRFPTDIQKSILQMAIQGKLVEQRPEEGTGEELHKQIQSEKQRLVKTGVIKKEKPLPEITEDEKPFDIPETWKWVRLRTIVYNRGQEVPSTVFSYIDIGSIDNKNQRLNKEENLINPDDAPSRARKIVELGDILYSTVRPYLHNMCIIDRQFSCKPIASTGFAAMTCYKGVFNKFLFNYLMSPSFDSYANHTDNSKGVAYPAINDDRLYRALIPLPPFAEQERIVAKLEEILPLYEKLK